MKVKIMFLLFIFGLVISLPLPAYSVECQGNACDYITVVKRNGCVTLVNSHEKLRIKVTSIRSIPRYVYTVYPQSEEVVRNSNGQCFSDYFSIGMEANFE